MTIYLCLCSFPAFPPISVSESLCLSLVFILCSLSLCFCVFVPVRLCPYFFLSLLVSITFSPSLCARARACARLSPPRVPTPGPASGLASQHRGGEGPPGIIPGPLYLGGSADRQDSDQPQLCLGLSQGHSPATQGVWCSERLQAPASGLERRSLRMR